MKTIEAVVLISMLLTGYGFWYWQLLRFIGWIVKKLGWLQSEAE